MISDTASKSAEPRNVHPRIKTLRQALSFKVAKLAALNERSGSLYFQKALGLRLNEWRVLGVIVPEGEMLFSELRDALRIDKGQLSKVVKSLNEQALITSRISDIDARQVTLSVTVKGLKTHEKALKFTQSRNDEVVATLTSEECAEFMHLLDKILQHNENLERALREGI